MVVKTLVILFGPPAVGKMTVGTELSRLTGLKLFHNHLSIELVLRFFDYDTPPFVHLVKQFRQLVFDEVLASDLPGLIFTYVWALELPGDKVYLDSLAQTWQAQGAKVYFVELQVSLAERLQRNRSDFRLAEKPSKRNLIQSEAKLLEHEALHRFNSQGDFFYPEQHLKLDNTELSASQAAEVIQRFLVARGFEPPALGLC